MKISKEIMQNWFISYDEYTDRFQIYDNMVFNVNINHFLIKKKDDYTVYINKASHQPMLFEISKLYDKVHLDVNSMKKNDIINLIEPFISKYA
ncbi:hypothetical protein CO051_04830 [Candidatus Roizmanbacteria bacterium CG_4_9_14_0_2_um_filter_39_13]|uniref:Uncharacterized protein n=2 Tax=Candidatus Roizmaniibacteriota TaxID=1752723 RepID=A0A2M8EXP1_9BACT|nr:MAG: hypothetical protein COY15_04885 [Candidatus Roizmanbacteria bacterium CG_4_10_14_0_2_um_filter_39_12]PJC30818.1 MAG: hypothetical protein CO051_04830 [Candidatus Roizmanbacteria bacterium CG_4_9_14_0_2_um_filter_39_13]PJE62251.1 MAG: hypothetical protein COU87_00235 [Candidatus Roizmanbacteria bacterium CG10_big_fil_rev_8_21_14_0_10_39_12]